MPNTHSTEGQVAAANTSTTAHGTTVRIPLEATTFARLAGGPNAPERRIGTVTLTADMTFRQHYETASNYHDVEVPAGTEVDLMSNGHYVSARFRGTITASQYVNRLFSAASTDVDELKGQPATYLFQTHAFAAIPAIMAKTFLGGAVVRLDGDVRFDVKQYDDGKNGVRFLYGITVAVD
jgi:hypothetical protein